MKIKKENLKYSYSDGMWCCEFYDFAQCWAWGWGVKPKDAFIAMRVMLNV